MEGKGNGRKRLRDKGKNEERRMNERTEGRNRRKERRTNER